MALYTSHGYGGNSPYFFMIEISGSDYQELIKKRNKYGAKKTVCRQKHLHDSKKEATRCDLLHVLLRGGHISRLKQQPKFVLQKGFKFKGKSIRTIVYIADFSYYEDGEYVIEDVKGKKTAIYSLKKKLLMYKLRNRKNCKFIET